MSCGEGGGEERKPLFLHSSNLALEYLPLQPFVLLDFLFELPESLERKI